MSVYFRGEAIRPLFLIAALAFELKLELIGIHILAIALRST